MWLNACSTLPELAFRAMPSYTKMFWETSSQDGQLNGTVVGQFEILISTALQCGDLDATCFD
jgi:hypothetical protein